MHDLVLVTGGFAAGMFCVCTAILGHRIVSVIGMFGSAVALAIAAHYL